MLLIYLLLNLQKHTPILTKMKLFHLITKHSNIAFSMKDRVAWGKPPPTVTYWPGSRSNVLIGLLASSLYDSIIASARGEDNHKSSCILDFDNAVLL